MAAFENYKFTRLFLLAKITFRNEHSCSFAFFIVNDLSPNLVFISYSKGSCIKKQTKTSKKWKCLCILTLFRFSVFVCENFKIFE